MVKPEQEMVPVTETAIAVVPTVAVISEVYLKIGTHWSPIDGNAAGQYGFGDIE